MDRFEANLAADDVLALRAENARLLERVAELEAAARARAPQVPPTPNERRPVIESVLEAIERRDPAFGMDAAQVLAVRRDLQARVAVGIERYGTPLQAFNGRDADRDAYEEALDLIMYLGQRIEELVAAKAPHGQHEIRAYSAHFMYALRTAVFLRRRLSAKGPQP